MTDTGAGPTLDDFPGGLLVTNADRRVLYANRYFERKLGFDGKRLRGEGLYALLSQASVIIFESYVLPLLLHEGECDEIQLAMINDAGDEVPVIINAVLGEAHEVYWSVYGSVQRNKLYQELVEARRLLEEKAAGLQTLSATDGLTGLLNRREVLRVSETLISGARRHAQSLSMLVVDIDNFKQINDGQGHTAGDTALKELGQRLQQHGRQSDIVGRFGGDEFVCVLPNSGLDEAIAFAERLHELVSAVAVGDHKLTISVGIATEVEHIEFERLFRKADGALYQAKSTGRSRMCVALDEDTNQAL